LYVRQAISQTLHSLDGQLSFASILTPTIKYTLKSLYLFTGTFLKISRAI
uniref:Uncharacterized protein n=1 Tax=Brugia timori TaxID=42155 RepID=A0A0R3QH19_9BILA